MRLQLIRSIYIRIQSPIVEYYDIIIIYHKYGKFLNVSSSSLTIIALINNYNYNN